MKKLKTFCLIIMITMLIANRESVKALATCDELTANDLNFYASLNRPDIYDLSCSNGTPYTDSYIASLNLSSSKVPQQRYYVNKLNVPTFAQETNYYCGPASMKQAIHTILGYSSSQYYYGMLIGTHTSAGTDQTYIAGAMNNVMNSSRIHMYGRVILQILNFIVL